MKVLVLNASPRGEQSSSLKLTHAFLRGMECRDPIIRHLSKLDIRPCKGCFACWKSPEGRCAVLDDMQDVLKDLITADIVIWSFPLYYYNVPGIMKTVIDRQLPMNLPFMTERADELCSGGHPPRYDLSHQRYVLLSTCGFYSSRGNYTAVYDMFDRMYGKGGYTAIACGQGELFQVPQLRRRTDEYLTYVETAGREYREGRLTERTKEQLDQLLYPREVFEEMADNSWGLEKDGGKAAGNGLAFTRQMAALYNKASYRGTDQILEFYYTDADKTYQIHLGRDGYQVKTDEFKPYTTRIETPLSVWEDISKGKITGQEALMKHQYKVLGDFDMMLHWDDYFSGGLGSGSGDEVKITGAGEDTKKTKMTLFLLPWIAIWSLLAMNPLWGGAAGIVTASLIPLFWMKWRATVFEYISIFAANIICMLSLLGIPAILLLPVSYLVFGILWTATVFLKTPLTAYYSKSAYGGERALQNPLFIRTNRILTACWGGLYLLTPIWTYLLMTTEAASYIGLLNCIFPLLLGAFTRWFQHFYPAWYANS